MKKWQKAIASEAVARVVQDIACSSDPLSGKQIKKRAEAAAKAIAAGIRSINSVS